MDIANIASREFYEVSIDERIGKVRAIFDEDNPKAVVVTNDGEYQGVITQKRLVSAHVEDATKVAALTQPAPRVDRTGDVREVSRVLVEGATKAAPVYESDALWGIVSEDAILEAVLDSFDALRVTDVATDDVVTVTRDADVGRVVNRLREHDISRVPVVTEAGRLAGIVTTRDVVGVVTHNADRMRTGDRAGEAARALDLPVDDVLSSPVETTTPDASLREAVATMLDNDYAGLVVTPADDDGTVVGIVTKTDVLRALSYTQEDHLDVQITNVGLLDTISRREIRERIERVADKYADMQVHHAHVRFHEHKEKLRGIPLVRSGIRLRTDHGQVAGSGEGYGGESAFHIALDTLERNVLELKGIERDEQYRGQLLRKLGEL